VTTASHFHFGAKSLPLSEPQVMGILNLTVDSFSDGGELLNSGKPHLDAVLERAVAMVEAGASLLDLGAESTRPGAQPVGEQEEMDRVLPVLEHLRARLDVVYSLDTSSPALMREGARLGAGLVNDVRALGREGAMQAARDSDIAVCLMHMQGQPQTMQLAPHYEDVVGEVTAFLLERARACEQAGIARERILLDPGFGFGKTLEHNLRLLKQLNTLAQQPYPLLVGMSRKGMLGQITGKPAKDRVFAGLAAALIAVDKGAWIIRTHDVAATTDALKLWRRVALID